MKYTKEERLEIGRRLYEGEINRARASLEYDIDMYTARDYMRLYKAAKAMTEEKLAKEGKLEAAGGAAEKKPKRYEEMTKEELLRELRRLTREKNLETAEQ